MPPPIHEDPPEVVEEHPWPKEETPVRLLEWGTLMVAFGAGLITATRKDKVAPFLLGWGASAAITWWLSKQ